MASMSGTIDVRMMLSIFEGLLAPSEQREGA
jgi:hypothetical protein